MTGKINYGKIAICIFLTVLIWVWADLAQDDEFAVYNATITVAKSNPNFWVSFDGYKSSVPVEKIVLKGPASKIAEQEKKLKEVSRLEFDFDATQENMTEPGSYTLSMVSFLRKDKRIKRLGLTVESCKPDKLSVNVVKLVEKSLDVICVDEDQNPVKTKTIEPPKVDMLVPENWEGEKLIAKVQLTQREIEQARTSTVEKTPYIKLSDGQSRVAATAVKITTLPEQERLRSYTITTATLGLNLSANLQGKYKVEVTNLDAVMSAITIKATPEAKRVYENMLYQVILEIDDEDVKIAEPRRELVYNFPIEYVRKNEIELNQQPIIARFKLTPLPGTQTP